MSTKDEEIDIITKRRIIAYLGHKDLMKISKAKIFTTDCYAEHWLDSGLEGYLCFVTDSDTKTRYFIMYSYNNYEKLFEMELYNNFNSYYTVLTDYFHCFEFCNGFIGFRFFSADSAKVFKVTVNKFDDKLLHLLMSSKVKKGKSDGVVKKNLEIAKSKFYVSKMKYDSSYIEDEIFISKPRYFELLGNITYDNEKKIFIINEKETKELLKRAGISKNKMKDTSFALDIFKKMIESLDNTENQSIINLNIRRVHNYPGCETSFRNTTQFEKSKIFREGKFSKLLFGYL